MVAASAACVAAGLALRGQPILSESEDSMLSCVVSELQAQACADPGCLERVLFHGFEVTALAVRNREGATHVVVRLLERGRLLAQRESRLSLPLGAGMPRSRFLH